MAQKIKSKNGCKPRTAEKNGKKGFTIIEVVLVLAIAGLIFLMVFIALPALQRAQRNTSRQNDLSRFLTAVTAYQSNNNGNLPFEPKNATKPATITAVDGNFINRYIDSSCPVGSGIDVRPVGCGDQFTDPDGTIFRFTKGEVGTVADSTGAFPVQMPKALEHSIAVVVHATCGQMEGTVRDGTGPRQVALLMTLEGGAIACNDNQ